MTERKKSKYDSWSPLQHAFASELLREANAARAYKNYTGTAMATDPGELAGAQKYYNNIARTGGLDPAMATDLARYKMWQEGKEVPEGPRRSPPSDSERTALGAALVSGDPATRAQAIAESHRLENEEHQGYFDGLISQNVTPYDDPPPPALAVPADEPPPAIAAPVQSPQAMQQPPQPQPMLASNDTVGASDRRVKKRIIAGDNAAEDFLEIVRRSGTWPAGVRDPRGS